MFLSSLIKIEEEHTGAIDECLPFLCRYAGKASLLQALRGETDDYRWESISVDEAESVKIAVLMYVKYIHINSSKSSIFNINLIQLIKNASQSVKRPILKVSINGVLVQSVLFLKDKYKQGEGHHPSLNTDDQVYVKQLNANLSGFVLQGTFNLKTCSYYHQLG